MYFCFIKVEECGSGWSAVPVERHMGMLSEMGAAVQAAECVACAGQGLEGPAQYSVLLPQARHVH